MGRFIAVFTMFSGIIIVALPITVIGANFEKQFEKQVPTLPSTRPLDPYTLSEYGSIR